MTLRFSTPMQVFDVVLTCETCPPESPATITTTTVHAADEASAAVVVRKSAHITNGWDVVAGADCCRTCLIQAAGWQ